MKSKTLNEIVITKKILTMINKFNNDLQAFAEYCGDEEAVLYEDIATSFTLSNVRIEGNKLKYQYDGREDSDTICYFPNYIKKEEEAAAIEEGIYFDDTEIIKEQIKFWRECLRRAKKYWKMSSEKLDAMQEAAINGEYEEEGEEEDANEAFANQAKEEAEAMAEAAKKRAAELSEYAKEAAEMAEEYEKEAQNVCTFFLVTDSKEHRARIYESKNTLRAFAAKYQAKAEGFANQAAKETAKAAEYQAKAEAFAKEAAEAEARAAAVSNQAAAFLNQETAYHSAADAAAPESGEAAADEETAADLLKMAAAVAVGFFGFYSVFAIFGI